MAGGWSGDRSGPSRALYATGLAASLYYYFTGLPYYEWVGLAGMVPFFLLLSSISSADAVVRGEIGDRISRSLGKIRLDRLQVHSRDLPAFRFVDIFRAAEAFCTENGADVVIESTHDEDLNALLHGQAYAPHMRRIKLPGRKAWPVGPAKEDFLPNDRFWLRTDARAAGGRLVVRVRYLMYQERVSLEIAGENAATAEAALREILDRSTRESIYRKRVLEMVFEAAIRDDGGDIESPERMLVHFKPDDPVPEEDIILEPEIREILWRNVVDLQNDRERLKRHGVPVRRGVLLFGPPGTGKTYACRYLYGSLPETTTIVVTGTALLHVKSIFNFARMLQPALVILEDVDLVFQSRDVNLYSSVLGELLDQMDGLQPNEDIGFILTTNAIDRLEAAIKDRPGRISQCIHFGAPTRELRARYLERALRDHPAGAVDLDRLLDVSDGATQAFLKEWVVRALQFAVERLGDADALALSTDDFDRALHEMRRHTDKAAGAIIGFGVHG